MAVTLLERPGVISWAGNPFYYRFQFSLMPVNSRLQIQVLDSTGALITDLNYPLVAPTGSTTGTVKAYLDQLIGTKTKYVRPDNLIVPDAKKITQITAPVFDYKIQWRAISPGVTTPAFTVDNPLKVIRGGIGDMTYIGEALTNQYTGSANASFLPGEKRWLTWVPAERFMRPEEYGWLTWISLAEYAPRPTIRYNVYYADGTTVAYVRTWDSTPAIFQYTCWSIPIGVVQAELDPAGKGVLYYDVQIVRTLTLDSYRINVDNLPRYDALTLYYRNSVGGWDNVSIYNKLEQTADVERGEYEQSRPVAANGANNYFISSFRPRWSGVTGYLSRAHCIALVDAVNSMECALLYNGQWLPVRMLTKSVKFASTIDKLHSVPLEFEAAGSFTSYPKQLLSL